MRSKRALITSIVLAVVAVFLMYAYTQQKIGIFAKRFKQIAVVVATKDIYQNTPLSESMLEYKLVPAPYVEPNAVLDKTARVNDYVAAINIKEGEQITEQKLLRLGEAISVVIPKDKRAITIPVNDISGVAGLVRPRDKVDIIGIFKTIDEKTKIVGNAEAVTVLQGVTVLAIGRNYMLESVQPSQAEKGAGQADINFSNLTLLLSPREAMDIALAQELGNLTLTLRAKFEDEPIKTYPELKNQRSTPSSVTGIKEQFDITSGPRWLEQRGEKSAWVR